MLETLDSQPARGVSLLGSPPAHLRTAV